MSAPRDCEAESVRAGIDIWTFDSKASRVGMATVRSESEVEGSMMWGTVASSGKKLTASKLADLMTASRSSTSASGAAFGVIAGTCVPAASLGAASAHEAGSSSAERELSTSGALATGSGGVSRLSVVRLLLAGRAAAGAVAGAVTYIL